MILIGFGTRPEYLKLKSVIQGFDFYNIKYKLLFIKQHTDIIPECKYDYSIDINDSSNRINSIIASVMDMPDYIFDDITHTVVQGDTTSAFALAMNAYFRKIKVIHIEAGVRTFNTGNPFPEEINRQLISKFATVHFCPTNTDLDNIQNEHGDKYVVGNTVIDFIKDVEPQYTNKVLITLHRRDNWNKIHVYFKAINKIAKENKDIEFILPIHPNKEIRKHANLLSAVNVVEPMQHDEIIKIIAESLFVITDSGGIIDEACYLGKKVIVIRDTIENQKLGVKNIHMCYSVNELNILFYEIKKYYNADKSLVFGNGEASNKIVKILMESYLQ